VVNARLKTAMYVPNHAKVLIVVPMNVRVTGGLGVSVQVNAVKEQELVIGIYLHPPPTGVVVITRMDKKSLVYVRIRIARLIVLVIGVIGVHVVLFVVGVRRLGNLSSHHLLLTEVSNVKLKQVMKK
jgi:hypothetical protein